ncbi:glycosyltransferase family 2 protein [Elioraea rosea]|uniref:glycosyltransferase family 2 protein n=1 Tax=Elioraea rosea TaxID=2492390 RepID=UPI00118345DF|nr:glycosyltransferase family A protein [Elioraea rosea]
MTAPVSVVIPLHNAARHIGAALDSIAWQTLAPAETIVIDDGSTDGGGAIVAARDTARLIAQPNRGVAAARNAGLAAAAQRFVAFLDADDLWCPGHLAGLVELAGRFPDAAVFGAHFLPVPAEATLEDARRAETPEGHLRRADYVAEAASGMPPFFTSSCMVRAEAARELGGFPEGESHGEDMALWIRLSERDGAAATTSTGALYRRSGTGLTGRTVAVPDAAMRAIDALLPAARPERRDALRALRSRLALAHTLDALARGDRACARAALAEAGSAFAARRLAARLLLALPAPAARAAFTLRTALMGHA